MRKTKDENSEVWAKVTRLIEKSMPNGIRFSDLFDMVKGRKNESDYYSVIGSKDTFTKILRRLTEQGFIKRDDSDHRLYKITSEGKKYVERSEIVDFILTSDYWDSYFRWNPESKQPEIALYNFTEEKQNASDHPMALLLSRSRRKNSMDWIGDIVDYALKTELFDAKDVMVWSSLREGKATPNEIESLKGKIQDLWKTLFKGVERMTVVETINPQLLLERIESELNKVC